MPEKVRKLRGNSGNDLFYEKNGVFGNLELFERLHSDGSFSEPALKPPRG